MSREELRIVESRVKFEIQLITAAQCQCVGTDLESMAAKQYEEYLFISTTQ